MTEHDRQNEGGTFRREPYMPPRVVVLGSLAELTQKNPGAADGTTFLGIDIGT